jgi:hypothetical protein
VSNFPAARPGRRAIVTEFSAGLLTMGAAHADPVCQTITAPALEIAAVDCAQQKVWIELQRSRRFPDVFSGSGKMTNLCYASTGPVTATIGKTKVVIAATLSGWTTDFQPTLLGGTDNLGTVITEISIANLPGHASAQLFTRDTIDLSQITTSGTAPEEDVIIGGSNTLEGAKGTYRVASAPEDPQATKVELTNLNSVICVHH